MLMNFTMRTEYMDALGESIDAVVVGGYWGEGRRGGLLSSFLVGLRDEQPDGTTRYVSPLYDSAHSA